MLISVQKRLTKEVLLFELLLTLHEKRSISYIQIDTRMTGDYGPTCAKFVPFFQFPKSLYIKLLVLVLDTYQISQCLPEHQMKDYNPTKLHFPIQFLVTAFLFSP